MAECSIRIQLLTVIEKKICVEDALRVVTDLKTMYHTWEKLDNPVGPVVPAR